MWTIFASNLLKLSFLTNLFGGIFIGSLFRVQILVSGSHVLLVVLGLSQNCKMLDIVH